MWSHEKNMAKMKKSCCKVSESSLITRRTDKVSPSDERCHCPVARVAQLVEQRIENPRVGGSNPPPGTIFSYIYQIVIEFLSIFRFVLKIRGPMPARVHLCKIT